MRSSRRARSHRQLRRNSNLSCRAPQPRHADRYRIRRPRPHACCFLGRLLRSSLVAPRPRSCGCDSKAQCCPLSTATRCSFEADAQTQIEPSAPTIAATGVKTGARVQVAFDGRTPRSPSGAYLLTRFVVRNSGLGAVFDATPPYPGYAWTRDGRSVKPEEFGTIAGPGHCGWQSATFLSIGWPVGTLSTSAAQARQYIRDPNGVVRSILRDRLDLNARVPSDARPTGYTYDSIQVYLSPTDQDEAIYVVGPFGSERWPRSDPMTLCE